MDDDLRHKRIVSKIGLISQVKVPVQTNSLFFRSSLPNGTYDKNFHLENIWKQLRFTKVICLISRKEYKRKTNTNKQDTYYFLRGAEYIQFPIYTKMFKHPDWMKALYFMIQSTIIPLLNSYNHERICIHCSGGVGRTGMVYACIFMHLGYDYKQSLHFVYENIPKCLNSKKRKMLKKYYKFYKLL